MKDNNEKIANDIRATEELVRVLTLRVESKKNILAALVAELATNPLHALEWSQAAFEAAATVDVFTRLKSALQKPYEGPGADVSENARISRLARFSSEEVMRAGRYPLRSTSVTANLVAQEAGRAWADAHDLLTAYVDKEA